MTGSREALLLVTFCICLGITISCQEACYPLTTAATDNEYSSFNATLDQLTIEGQCYTACIELLSDVIRPQRYYEMLGVWYTVSYRSLSQNCSFLQKALECKNGCILRATSGLTGNECRDTCYNGCQNECQGVTCDFDRVNTTCVRRCRKPPCRQGCNIAIGNSSIMSGGGEATLMPLLVATENMSPGNIGITLASTVTPNSSNVASFIMRLEEQQRVHYMWFPTLINLMLNLTQYSCQSVNISYAAVNKYGRTRFSPALVYCVRGEYRYPQQLQTSNINITYTEDLRPQYLRHAIVNISWNSPVGLEYATHYELRLKPLSGLGRNIYSFYINKTSLWYVLKADVNFAAVFGNRYIFELVVHPAAPGDKHASTVMNPLIVDSSTPNMSLKCTPVVTDSLNITINWAVANDSYLLATIDKYIVRVTDSSGQHQDEFNVNIEDGQFEFSYDLGPYNLFDRQTSHNYTVHVIAFKSRVYFWRIVPVPVSCVVSGTWPEISPVAIRSSDIQLTELDTQYIVISWYQPTLTYGPILSYQLSIKGVILTTQANVTNQTVDTELLPDCSYVQIRSRNGFDWSNWSEPLLVKSCITTTAIHNIVITSSSTAVNMDYFTVYSSVNSYSPTSHPSTSAYIYSSTSTVSSRTSIETITPSLTTTSIAVPIITAVSDGSTGVNQLAVTIYFLLGVIGMFLILIPLTLLGLVIMCCRYRMQRESFYKSQSVVSSRVPQDKKNSVVTSAENRLAIDNVYSSITIPPVNECHYSTPV